MVISRSDRLAEIGHEDVERTVGARVTHTFPSDYRQALQALNKGQPISSTTTTSLPASFHDVCARALAGVVKPRSAKQPGRRASWDACSGRKSIIRREPES